LELELIALDTYVKRRSLGLWIVSIKAIMLLLGSLALLDSLLLANSRCSHHPSTSMSYKFSKCFKIVQDCSRNRHCTTLSSKGQRLISLLLRNVTGNFSNYKAREQRVASMHGFSPQWATQR
jgi:hypothetical protein